MNKEGYRRITSRILEEADQFMFYATQDSYRVATEVFEEMGLKVKRGIPYIDDSSPILEVHK